MDDLNDLLAQYGITETIPANDEAVEAMSPQETTESLSEDDINDVLGNYGIQAESHEEQSEETGTPEPQDLQPQVIEPQNQEPYNPQPQTPEPQTIEPQEEGLIPPNSPTLLIDDSTSRFSGTEWYNEIQKSRVIIGGMGGISSHLALNVARMKPHTIVMYDDDIVETANMSGQLYQWGDVGLSKVDAMSENLRNFTSVNNIYAIRERFTANSEAGDIMMCGFDNMSARKVFFNAWKKHILTKPEEERSKCLFLDGRLSLTVMQVLCIAGDDDWSIKRYEDEFLFSEEDAEETVCSMKQTTYLASMIGAMMANLFTNFIANTLAPVIPYSLPFFTEYDAQYMIFKTEN